MGRDYFSFDEVNELIPQLEYHFRKLLEHKKEMAQTSQELRRLGVTPQLLGRIPNQARPDVQKLQMVVRNHYREFKNHIFAIENLGGEIKDLELGRVDFPAMMDGEEMVLAWQLGVTEVAVPQPLDDPGENNSKERSPEVVSTSDLA